MLKFLMVIKRKEDINNKFKITMEGFNH